MKYEILENFERDNLERLVRSYLNQGWEPVGNVSLVIYVYGGMLNRLYVQSMILIEEEDLDGQSKNTSNR